MSFMRSRFGLGLSLGLAMPSACGGGETRVNQAPTAVAGDDRTVARGAMVLLDGEKSSDPEGDKLNFTWVLRTPTGSSSMLSDSNTARARFVADVKGEFVATLTVDDGRKSSVPDAMTVSVANRRPIAKAGPDRVRTIGAPVELDATESSDPDSDPLTYHWVATRAPFGSNFLPENDRLPKTTVTPDLAGEYEVTIEVFDGTATATDGFALRVRSANHAPVARVGPDQQVSVGQPVTLDGSSSDDPDGDSITYSWSVERPASSLANFDDRTLARPVLIPDVPGEYTAFLVVSDGEETSPSARTRVIASVQSTDAGVADASSLDAN
ncbi:MAG: hypothetical protein HY791_11745 [Deltaproteobacteria bacterium]|nr:hypothetical protein [Deltaproteobacteria bacterium]